jgi:crotonobetainyl-CoA:carnitine CoA-transferase CaiB-like acyl-CoA transferase
VTPGLLDGLRVVELASEQAAFAGKLLAGMGAEVVVVEPTGGHPSRRFPPFAGDVEGPERSLWWRHYNTGKRSVTIDLGLSPGVFGRLVATADVVLEAEPPGRLAGLGLDFDDFHDRLPRLIWASVTPFGRGLPRAAEHVVDLTVQASGGPVWSCGYDDHGLPPVRGGGNQGYQTASIWAVMGTLVALVHRDVGGTGQRVDISMHAAANVTTELGSYGWLVERKNVQRQTGRHASSQPTMETVAVAADGVSVTTGLAPRTGREYQQLLAWLDELGARAEFDDLVFLEMGAELERIDVSRVGVDPVMTEIYASGRSAAVFIASRLNAYDFFVQGQRHGLTCGIIYAPEELMGDRHFVSRGFPQRVDDDVLGMTYAVAGAPFLSDRTSFTVTRAPAVGEHNHLLDAL